MNIDTNKVEYYSPTGLLGLGKGMKKDSKGQYVVLADYLAKDAQIVHLQNIATKATRQLEDAQETIVRLQMDIGAIKRTGLELSEFVSTKGKSRFDAREAYDAFVRICSKV